MQTPQDNFDLVMLGSQPPPVRGMSLVNAAMLNHIRGYGFQPIIIDLAIDSLNRSTITRLKRLPKVVVGLKRFWKSRRDNNGVLYISASAGAGKLYDILFLILARVRRWKIYVHHHSFAYLNKLNLISKIYILTAGKNAIHISLSNGMANKLSTIYKTKRNMVISNVVFLPSTSQSHQSLLRKSLNEVGFLSNISEEKGILDFLDLMAFLDEREFSIKGVIAGPFENRPIEKEVNLRLRDLSNTSYVGPKYGKDKDEFLKGIDALIFPTRYKNEAEPLIILEAMRNGLPIIVFGRGAIPEIVDSSMGKIINPGDDFIAGSFSQIEKWLSNHREFQLASQLSIRKYEKLLDYSNNQLDKLIKDMLKIQV